MIILVSCGRQEGILLTTLVHSKMGKVCITTINATARTDFIGCQFVQKHEASKKQSYLKNVIFKWNVLLYFTI